MKTIEEILQLSNEAEKIEYIKKGRKTILPNVDELLDDWNPCNHKVTKEEYRKDAKILKKEGYVTDKGVRVPAVYDTEKVNRISLPIEQDIVNIHTAFTVGKEPKLTCEPDNDAEKNLFKISQAINRKNKIRFHNKQIVRSWLSETEVAEYWYATKEDVIRNDKSTGEKKVTSKYSLKCAIWSPFRGDKLYPYFDKSGDYKALGREYRIKEPEGTETYYFMLVTDKDVYKWKQNETWELVEKFTHRFPKNPTIYAYRPESLCSTIKSLRERLEELKSDFADCIKQHFFPKLILEGELANGTPYDIGKSKMLKIEGQGKAYYLDWQQTPEMVRTEMDSLYNDIYSLTNTPRISFDSLKGSGNVLSGVAFDYVFMSTHLAVDTHAETIGLFLQRRENFKIAAIASMYPGYDNAAEAIDISVDIVPYRIEDMKEKIEKAISANGGKPVASLKTGVIMAGIVDDVDDEVENIKNEMENNNVPNSNKKEEI